MTTVDPFKRVKKNPGEEKPAGQSQRVR